MTVPVLWVSLHDDVLARGYHDQALIEALFDHSLWRVPHALTFEHHEVRGPFPDVEGAVVVVPYRHHHRDTEWLRLELAKLEWSVLMLVGDEEWEGPWQRLALGGPQRPLWIMQPRPEHAEHASVMLPCGWYPRTREGLTVERDECTPRTLPWLFAGQVTHPRREQLARRLRRVHDGGMLFETDGYLRGWLFVEYLARVADTRVMPCPSGPKSVCTARVEEALEAGAVPVLDMLLPEREQQFDYWSLLWPDHPLRTTTDWRTFPDVLADIDWPTESTRAWSWWQQQKRRYAYALDADVRAAARLPALAGSGSPSDAITVIVTTSPVTMHPRTDDIECTIDSVRAHLPDAEVIVVADGVRPEQEHLRARYAEYLHRLCWVTNFHYRNVVPLVLDEWVHQANAVRAALALVTTPLVLFMEHDTPLKETPIQWAELCALIESGEANSVRFHHEDRIHPEHEGLMVDHETRDVVGVPVRRTMTWWQRPHLASTEFYRGVLDRFPTECRSMIEDFMYGVVSSAHVDRGDAAWDDWRLYVYTPDGGMQRSWHLDSRGDEPKYTMLLPGKDTWG